MADPIRLFAEFKDDLGNDYRLNIHQAGWQVTPFEFNLGADGFTLRYTGDNENRMQAVIGSEVTFTLVENDAQHSLFITALATSQDSEFTLSIYKDPDNTNTLFWTGVILSEQIELVDEAYPIMNTFTAVDELGNLKNILYNNNGVKYTGRDNIAVHITKAILKTRALHIYDSTDFIIQYSNNFFPTTDFASTNALIESRVDHSAFYNVDSDGVIQFFDTFTVLENLCTTFNSRLFYANGIFNFIPIGAAIDDSDLTLWKITKSAVVSATSYAVNAQKDNGTDFIKLAGGSSTFLPPLQKVKRTWIINANLPLFTGIQYLNPNTTQDQIGDTITDQELVYSSSSELRLQLQYQHTYPGGSSAFINQNIPARIVLRFVIKCGSLYYKNAISFGPGSQWIGDYEENYTAQVMSFTDGAWSAGEEYYYLPVTVNNSWMDRNTGYIYQEGTTWNTQVLDVLPNGNPLVLDLPALPSQQVGIEFTALVVAFNHEGVIITDVIDSTAFGKLNVAMFAMTGNATNGDELVYNANTGNNGREIYEQMDVQIGSIQYDTQRNITDYFTPGEPINEWGSLLYPTADLPIHSLGLKEILAGQNDSTPVKRGGYINNFLTPFDILLFDGDRYLPFETSFIARSVEGEFEAFELLQDTGNIVAPEPEIIDTHNPQDEGEPVYDFRNIVAADSGAVAPNILQRMVQQPVTAIENRNAAVYNVTDTDYMMFNTWAGANGSSLIYLPTVTGNEGRTMQFHSDSTISANTYTQLRPFATDTGVTIDGAASYDFDRAYDGITILCHGGQWYIIQKKEK